LTAAVWKAAKEGMMAAVEGTFGYKRASWISLDCWFFSIRCYRMNYSTATAWFLTRSNKFPVRSYLPSVQEEGTTGRPHLDPEPDRDRLTAFIALDEILRFWYQNEA